MYYTDYTKQEIFTNRQQAIVSSRFKAKNAFFDALVMADYTTECDEYVQSIHAFIVRKASDYNDIKALFEAYERDRSTIYEVKINLEDKTGF